MTDWKINLSDIDLGKQELESVAEVLLSRWLTMGAVTQKFESAFAEYCGVKHAVAVTNGTAALHLAHWALGIGKGDEVICPSLSFVATANAVLYCHATPVFADVGNLNNLNITGETIRQKISPRTRCITVMHYGGYPCDMEAIQKLAREHDLAIIEDACHAPGSEYNGKKCGTLGNLGCFSFFSNKNMVTGEGGMVVTDNPDLAQKLRSGRSHAMTAMTWDRHHGHAFSYDVVEIGFNYRIDEVRSAMGLAQLEKLAANNKKRRHFTRHYREKLSPVPGLVIPFHEHPGHSACHLFPILLPRGCNRNRFMEKMKSRGIQTSIHYPPIHRFRYYREHLRYSPGPMPVTEEIGLREITLPLHPLMTIEEVDYVCFVVKKILTDEVK